MARYARGESPVTNEKPHLDIAIKGSLSKVGRGHKHCLVVGNRGLGMEDTARTVLFQRPTQNTYAFLMWLNGSISGTGEV